MVISIIKKQQEILTSNNASVHRVCSVNKAKVNFKKGIACQNPQFKENDKRNNGKKECAKSFDICKWYGKSTHNRKVCPVKDTECLKCSKLGHFAQDCKNKLK